jgi:hypothetical protein
MPRRRSEQGKGQGLSTASPEARLAERFAEAPRTPLIAGTMAVMNDARNIYAHDRSRVWDEFAANLSGSREGLFVAVCTASTSEEARTAIVKSAQALGYGADGVTFVTIDATGTRLTAPQLIDIVESMDPLCVVAADAGSTLLVAEAAQKLVEPNEPTRLNGREVRAFDDLNDLMQTPAGKQKAWALLKTLPSFPRS